MNADIKDKSKAYGYEFDTAYRFDAADISGWDFRFRILGVSGSDIVKTIGDGVTADNTLKQFRVAFEVDFAPGQYRYTADWKHPGSGWKMLQTGEFKVTDPRGVP